MVCELARRRVTLQVRRDWYTGGMTKSCRQCEAEISRAGLCAPCRTERRKQKHREAQARYEAKREISVPMWTVVEQLTEAHAVRLVQPLPLRGRRTPRGPDEGQSTTNPALSVLLDQKAAESYEHPWWDEHPEVFSDL